MAAITSWTTLKTAVADWMAKTNLTGVVPDFIQFGEARIYRDLRIRCMETALDSDIASGVVAVPTGYIELKHAYVNSSPVQTLQRKDAEWIYHNYPDRSGSGSPKFIAREAENFIFGPYPASTYNVKGVYYKKLDALSASNETNWFITNAPDLLLFAALCEAAPYMNHDERIVTWEKKYDQVRARVQADNDNEEYSGSILAVTTR
jgi:hypothetical protein